MAMSKEVVREMMKEKDVVVLNVLSPDAYKKIHIKNSENLPLADRPETFVRMVKKLYGGQFYFITYGENSICASGPIAARALKDHGFYADYYQGGIEEWVAAGYPIRGKKVTAFAIK
jgi:rhodanese-related sulfurtransferase